MAKCTICKEEVILHPSAAERAKRYGETAAFYTKLFPDHTHCTLAKRKADTSELMARIRSQNALRDSRRVIVGVVSAEDRRKHFSAPPSLIGQGSVHMLIDDA